MTYRSRTQSVEAVWKKQRNLQGFKQMQVVFSCQKYMRFVLCKLNRTSPVSFEKTAFKYIYLQLKGMKKATQRGAFKVVGPPGLEPGRGAT